ncbi:MAG: sulfatase-like hydrolase/transferase [Planctomycetota bacterium]|jgi:arylsulfatase A-like enzyme
MNRRSFLKYAAMGAAGLVSSSWLPALGQTTGKKPDVLFIAIDDMNDWTTLFNPENPIKTPNLVRLAKRGMFFSRAYCVVPACTPSRTAILTGYSPTTSGSYRNGDFLREVVPDAVTLPDYFRRSGYSAKGAGKIFTHFNGAMGGDPAGKSFDEFQPMPCESRAPEKNYNGYTEKEEPLHVPAFDWGEHRQKMIDIDMVEYIEKVMDQERVKPMFLAAGIFKPHLPFYAPPETFEKYPFDETIFPEMKDNDLDDVPEIGKEMAHTEHFIYSNTTARPDNDPGSLKKMIQCYQASADFCDQMVGRLLDKLDETGKADNTIIVLWADHGYHLGDKESCVKFTLWEKANRVPFIIVAPGVAKRGSRCDRPVSLLDIYPTLIELAGLAAKKDLDGKSLVPLLKEPTQKWHPALMTMGKGNHAVRSDRWRYIRYKDGTEELYDHSKDPWEWTNLAGEPEYAQVIEEHKKRLPKYEK